MGRERLIVQNRKARFAYEILEHFTGGLVLTGTEIKSIRDGRASLVDAYCLFLNEELWVRGMHIAEYTLGTFYNHTARRDRKLLLTRRELSKLQRSVEVKGNTIIPLRLIISERGYAKLVIALAKGKQRHDKRDTLRQKDADRELRRATKLRF